MLLVGKLLLSRNSDYSTINKVAQSYLAPTVPFFCRSHCSRTHCDVKHGFAPKVLLVPTVIVLGLT